MTRAPAVSSRAPPLSRRPLRMGKPCAGRSERHADDREQLRRWRPAGFLMLNQQGLNTDVPVDMPGMQVQPGAPTALQIAGEFWAVNDGQRRPKYGQKAFAYVANGKVAFAAAGTIFGGASSTAAAVANTTSRSPLRLSPATSMTVGQSQWHARILARRSPAPVYPTAQAPAEHRAGRTPFCRVKRPEVSVA